MIPPTLSTGTHATKFPRREVVVISVSGVYRHSVLKLSVELENRINGLISHLLCFLVLGEIG